MRTARQTANAQRLQRHLATLRRFRAVGPSCAFLWPEDARIVHSVIDHLYGRTALLVEDNRVRLVENVTDRQEGKEMRCRLCGKTALEIYGWLKRINELGVAGIWECRPACDATLPPDEAVLGALEDKENC